MREQLQAANGEVAQLKSLLDGSGEAGKNHEFEIGKKDGALTEVRNLLHLEMSKRDDFGSTGRLQMELEKEQRLTQWYQSELAKKEMQLSQSLKESQLSQSLSTTMGKSTLNSSMDGGDFMKRNKNLIMSIVCRWNGNATKELLQALWWAWKELLLDKKKNEASLRKLRSTMARWGDRQDSVILKTNWSAWKEFSLAERERKRQEKLKAQHASDLYQLRLKTGLMMAGAKNQGMDGTKLKMLISAWREFVVVSRREREQFVERERLKEVHKRQLEQMQRKQAMHLQADGSRIKLLLVWTSWREYVQISKKEQALAREERHKKELQKQQTTRSIMLKTSENLSVQTLLHIVWSAWREFMQEARLAKQTLAEKREMIAAQNKALDNQKQLRVDMMKKTAFLSDQHSGAMFVSMCFNAWRELIRMSATERNLRRSSQNADILRQRTNEDFAREKKLAVLEASGMKMAVLEIIGMLSNSLSPELTRSYLPPVWTSWKEMVRMSRLRNSKSLESLRGKKRAGSVAQKRSKKVRRMWLGISAVLGLLLSIDIAILLGLTVLSDYVTGLEQTGLIKNSFLAIIVVAAVGSIFLPALVGSLYMYCKLKKISIDQGRAISPT